MTRPYGVHARPLRLGRYIWDVWLLPGGRKVTMARPLRLGRQAATIRTERRDGKGTRSLRCGC